MKKQEIVKKLEGRKVLVTGGTGSFGNEIISQLIPFNPAEIVVFSRDEKKQYDMQQRFYENEGVRYVVGDVRDYPRLREVTRGCDILYHAAALKQVPHCEWGPYEAVQTNIAGAENVRRAAMANEVGLVLAISTDKAVKPVNVMGMTKALQEKIILNPVHNGCGTRFVCVRYGNVLGSRGSVVPLFCEMILQGKPIPITHGMMTRFQLTLEEAVELVFWATVKGQSGDLWVRKMPAARVVDLGRALAHGLTGRTDYPFADVGIRPGEKMHEVLVSEEEMWRAAEFDDHFKIPSWEKSQEVSGLSVKELKEYASSDVHQLTDEEITAMLKQDGWIADDPGPGPKVRSYYGK